MDKPRIKIELDVNTAGIACAETTIYIDQRYSCAMHANAKPDSHVQVLVVDDQVPLWLRAVAAEATKLVVSVACITEDWIDVSDVANINNAIARMIALYPSVNIDVYFTAHMFVTNYADSKDE
jgi:hypothetical protein